MTAFSVGLRRGAGALLGLVFLGLLAYAYVVWWGPKAMLGRRNARNVQRVQPGMRWSQARAIMGPAERTTLSANSGDGRTIYVYASRPFADDAIYLSVDPDSMVTGISRDD